MDKIKGLLVEPNKLPQEVEFEKKLENLQKYVKGYIEQTYLSDDDSVVIVCNEEGKVKGMKLNRYIGHDIIAGPFLILGDDYENGEFTSLTDVQIEKYKKRFDEKSIKETNKKIYEILFRKKSNDREER